MKKIIFMILCVMIIAPSYSQNKSCNELLQEGYMVFFEIEDNHTLYFSSQSDGSKIVYNNSTHNYTTNLPGHLSLSPNECIIVPPGVGFGLQSYKKHATDNEIVSQSVEVQWDDNKSIPAVKMWNGIEHKTIAYHKN